MDLGENNQTLVDSVQYSTSENISTNSKANETQLIVVESLIDGMASPNKPPNDSGTVKTTSIPPNANSTGYVSSNHIQQKEIKNPAKSTSGATPTDPSYKDTYYTYNVVPNTNQLMMRNRKSK